MFRQLLHSSIKRVSYIKKADLQTSCGDTGKWDLISAVLMERRPIICPELQDIEKEFKDYLSAVEFERSLKNETEINLQKERSLMSQKKVIDDLDIAVKQTTQDFIDACKEELAKFKPADPITKDDKANNLKSLHRKLDKSLILVLNQVIGNKEYYLLPQSIREDGETLRQCAERVIKEKCGPEIKAQIFGNAPCGVYKYRYPKSVRKADSVGAKVFIYYARYSSGSIINQKSDYKWLDKIELNQTLPDVYKKSVIPILLD